MKNYLKNCNYYSLRKKEEFKEKMEILGKMGFLKGTSQLGPLFLKVNEKNSENDKHISIFFKFFSNEY